MDLVSSTCALFLGGGYNTPADFIVTLDEINDFLVEVGNPKDVTALPLCVCPYAQTEWAACHE